MSIFRRHRPGRRHAEQLLDGATPPGFDDLAGLLDAARGPGPADAVAAGELPGEQAALAAFRSAFGAETAPLRAGTPARTPPEETNPVRSLALRRALAVKVLAAGALTVGLGGAAMAATGIPLVPGGTHRSTTAAAAASPSGSPSERPTGTPSSPDDRGPASGTRRPDAVRPGLDARAALLVDCRSWLAERGNGVRSGRRFDKLVTAAGGPDGVAAYCASLAVEICPTARPADVAGSGVVPGYLPGCPKPTPTAKGSRTRPVPTITPIRPEPTRTVIPPMKTSPTDPGHRPPMPPAKH